MDGFTIIPNAVFSLDVSPNAKLVLICLLKYSNYKIICPSTETLVNMSGLSERSVKYATKELDQAGIIKKTRRYKDSTIYEIFSALFARQFVSNESEGAKCGALMGHNLHTINNIKNNNLYTEKPNGLLDGPSVSQTTLTDEMRQIMEDIK